jgi:NAD(P)-dependent dehydrogenase (short-subunit alcohol dehydrogenase family)
MEIEDRKAIVVGGASGFGKATARHWPSVAVLDRPQSKGKEVADEIGERTVSKNGPHSDRREPDAQRPVPPLDAGQRFAPK